MAVRIKLAETTAELDAVFRLRHQVMVEEEAYMPPRRDERIYDRFDAYPTTANVVAIVEERIVGSIRFIEETYAGTTAEEYFDFHPFLPPGARPCASSLLVVARDYRHVPRLTFAMNGMGYYWSLKRGLTHVLAPANPERRDAFIRSGHKVVAPEFFHSSKKLPVLPMILALDELEDRFLSFVTRQGIRQILDAFERQFHIKGEAVVRQGEAGANAYVIVDGIADVVVTDEAGGSRDVKSLAPGDLFGEVALLTDLPRTASVVARTDLDLMVLTRDAFRAQLRADPLIAERLLNLVARRMASTV